MATRALESIVDERLTLTAFSALSGQLAGVPFVKFVVERKTGSVHFINNHSYRFHADYIAEKLLGESATTLDARLDEFNQEVYHSPERRFLLGTLALRRRKDGRKFFTIETVEVDQMGRELMTEMFEAVRGQLDPSYNTYFKPNAHDQEERARDLPLVSASALFEEAEYLPLNPGEVKGRLRLFESEAAFRASRDELEWYDIIVMDRVPDDIPRLSGIINSGHTTPLSHTNVLASGWQIPNAVQLGILARLEQDGLDRSWVVYRVDPAEDAVVLEPIDEPESIPRKPNWAVYQVRLEAPDVETATIVNLSELRHADRFRYGTKAANLGELIHLLDHGSSRVTGFYQLPRPPRENLLHHLAEFLDVGEELKELQAASVDFLRRNLRIPRGIALPFSLQREFLESSPVIQQTIGKLKMALQLEAREADSLCLTLQNLVRRTRIPDGLRERIDEVVTQHLLGASSFVVRSSSNAEDLEDFSAAGLYESLTKVSTAENLFIGIKEVWASLLSPRATRLRHQVGISLDDCYMGVIIQEQVPTTLGGVMVTVNPTNREDFRNVYINASPASVEKVVEGSVMPIQYLFNTVEGGGRTLSLGDAKVDLDADQLQALSRLAFAGRLLQSHFSPDYTFSWPVDIEWLLDGQQIYLLQLRPYAK